MNSDTFVYYMMQEQKELILTVLEDKFIRHTLLSNYRMTTACVHSIIQKECFARGVSVTNKYISSVLEGRVEIEFDEYSISPKT